MLLLKIIIIFFIIGISIHVATYELKEELKEMKDKLKQYETKKRK